MKQKLQSIIVVLFVLFVLFPHFSFAQQMEDEITVPSLPPTITITPTPDYSMPYPGILPDNPLYGIKTFRDKIISIMIGDPLKKASFDLLQADKRIGAALLLIKTKERAKQELALSTISKGQNYYEDAIARLAEAKKQGAGSTEITTNLKRASVQHLYLLQQAKKTLPKILQPTMEQLIQRSQRLQTQVKNIK